MAHTVRLENTFSGPMDLLLYLVRRDEIDIHDIPVAHLTREYLAEIERMDLVDVDAGGEFVAMASMLTEIKSRMLLPAVEAEEGDEEEDNFDPRQGLVRALLEYKRFKEAASELEEMALLHLNRFGRLAPPPPFAARLEVEAQELGALDLFAAFQKLARKMLAGSAPREIINEEVPTEVRIAQIEQVLEARERVEFTSLLSDHPTKDEMVGFFIALLELIRLKKIRAQQAVDFSEIYFFRYDSDAAQIPSDVTADVTALPVARRCQRRQTLLLAELFPTLRGSKTAQAVMAVCGELRFLPLSLPGRSRNQNCPFHRSRFLPVAAGATAICGKGSPKRACTNLPCARFSRPPKSETSFGLREAMSEEAVTPGSKTLAHASEPQRKSSRPVGCCLADFFSFRRSASVRKTQTDQTKKSGFLPVVSLLLPLQSPYRNVTGFLSVPTSAESKLVISKSRISRSADCAPKVAGQPEAGKKFPAIPGASEQTVDQTAVPAAGCRAIPTGVRRAVDPQILSTVGKAASTGFPPKLIPATRISRQPVPVGANGQRALFLPIAVNRSVNPAKRRGLCNLFRV